MEQVLNMDIKKTQFTTSEIPQCHNFSDMSITTARRQKDFAGMLSQFKTHGSQISIVQQSKLKVLVNRQFHVFSYVPEAHLLLQQISKKS